MDPREPTWCPHVIPTHSTPAKPAHPLSRPQLPPHLRPPVCPFQKPHGTTSRPSAESVSGSPVLPGDVLVSSPSLW